MNCTRLTIRPGILDYARLQIRRGPRGCTRSQSAPVSTVRHLNPPRFSTARNCEFDYGHTPFKTSFGLLVSLLLCPCRGVSRVDVFVRFCLRCPRAISASCPRCEVALWTCASISADLCANLRIDLRVGSRGKRSVDFAFVVRSYLESHCLDRGR